MSKRAAEDLDNGAAALKSGERPEAAELDLEGVGEFEDEFEDEYESEDEIIEAGVDGRPDAERLAEELGETMDVDQQTFIVGRHKLEPGQTLSPDLSTYEMLHALSTPWPCLSFDIIKDNLGDNRKTFPATMYAVAGTQAESKREKENQLMVMKFSGLSRMEREDPEESSDDEDEEADPILESKSIPLTSATNRIRSHQTPASDSSRPPTTLTASMTEAGQVLLHDITPHLTSFDIPGTVITPQQNKPLSTLRMHKSEGYAVDWSPLISTGKLVTGDNDGHIYVTTRTAGEGWAVDSRPFTGHSGSVEELQWSPTERNVFASASSDGTIKVWDVRSKSRTAALSVQVSNTDVNVMSWSHQTSHLLASGADDGVWGVWDLRQWKPQTSSAPAAKPSPVASFNFHKEQITSVEWHPTDDSIVAVAAGDNTLTLWDLAVELDDEESKDTGGVSDVPPQLLFVHYMEHVKECHWHPQIPGCVVGTGTAFNVFKTIIKRLFSRLSFDDKAALALSSAPLPKHHEALAFFVGKLDFQLLEDTPIPAQNKRWFVVKPPGSDGCHLLLAQASTAEQESRIGNQTRGRVFLFLYTDDFSADYNKMPSREITFIREPKEENYGTVAVFKDIYGNQWDLLQPNEGLNRGTG